MRCDAVACEAMLKSSVCEETDAMLKRNQGLAQKRKAQDEPT